MLVIVLTRFLDVRDELQMYKLRCHSYLTETVDAHKFQEVTKLLNSFC